MISILIIVLTTLVCCKCVYTCTSTFKTCTSSFFATFVTTHHPKRIQRISPIQVISLRSFIKHEQKRIPNLKLYYSKNNNNDTTTTTTELNTIPTDFYLPSSLTIILPAYNEERRISQTIESYYSYLNMFCNNINNNNNITHTTTNNYLKCNILVVDDGSTDLTCDVVEGLKKSLYLKNNQNLKNLNYEVSNNNNNNNCTNISYISLNKNQGKGFAISSGIKEIVHRYHTTNTTTMDNNNTNNNNNDNNNRGNLVLIADADGSGNIQSLEKMILKLWNLLVTTKAKKDTTTTTDDDKLNQEAYYEYNCPISVWDYQGMIIGNRGYSYNRMKLSRKITRWGFRIVVKLICGNLQNVNDTQCGFKLLTLPTGYILYQNLHLCRWTNDVEILYRAKMLNVSVMNMDIEWVDKDGSKLASSLWGIVRVSFVMLFEILWMRLQYLSGRWTIDY